MNKLIEIKGDNESANKAVIIVDEMQTCVLNAIHKANSSTETLPTGLTLYIGHKQYHSMMMIDRQTSAIMGRTSTHFMGVRYVRVIHEDYMRCV